MPNQKEERFEDLLSYNVALEALKKNVAMFLSNLLLTSGKLRVTDKDTCSVLIGVRYSTCVDVQ